MRKPRRLFRKRRQEADWVLSAEDQGTTIILGDPSLSDLQGYSRQIRSSWWKAYREEGIKNPIVVAVHKRSKIARERGLTEGSEFTFLAFPTHDAVSKGWLHPNLAQGHQHWLREPRRPGELRLLA